MHISTFYSLPPNQQVFKTSMSTAISRGKLDGHNSGTNAAKPRMAFQRITRSRTKAVASSVETDNKNVLSRPSLEKLPLEVLRMICEYVDSPGAPGLCALSQASKHCLAATSKSLCREIRFDVISRRKLQQDVSL